MTSPQFQTGQPLGEYLCLPHGLEAWSASNDGEYLVCLSNRSTIKSYDVYRQQTDQHYILRSGPRFTWIYTTLDHLSFPHHASVNRIDTNSVAHHSTARKFIPPAPVTDFWTVLRSYENQSLWDNFCCDGDGSWITDGILHGTLVCVHDESYMKEVDPTVCSAAYMIYCTKQNFAQKGQPPNDLNQRTTTVLRFGGGC